jgi:hypothetical protein
MLIFTPVDLPKIEPDDWDIFWDIWNTHSRPLVKVRQNTDLSVAPVGTNNIWIGLDVYKLYNTEMPYTAPYVDIKELLPNMHRQLLDIAPNLYRVRLLQSCVNIASHTDTNTDLWNLRAFIHNVDSYTQWYFTKPNDSTGERTYITMPADTNWFMYNDKHCWHGTDYDPDNKKILLQAFCFGSPVNIMERSSKKYKEFNLEY